MALRDHFSICQVADRALTCGEILRLLDKADQAITPEERAGLKMSFRLRKPAPKRKPRPKLVIELADGNRREFWLLPDRKKSPSVPTL